MLTTPPIVNGADSVMGMINFGILKMASLDPFCGPGLLVLLNKLAQAMMGTKARDGRYKVLDRSIRYR